MKLEKVLFSNLCPLCRALSRPMGKGEIIPNGALILCALEAERFSPLIEIEFRSYLPGVFLSMNYNSLSALGYLILKGANVTLPSNASTLAFLEEVRSRERAIIMAVEEYRPLYRALKGMVDAHSPRCLEVETLEPGVFRVTLHLEGGERRSQVLRIGRPSKVSLPYCSEFH